MFYHLSPTENKKSILENGLRAMRLEKVYLADNILDTFLLAPPIEEYMYLYKSFFNIHNQTGAYMCVWEKRFFEVSVFSVEILSNQTSSYPWPMPDKHTIESRLFGKSEGPNRDVFEYHIDYVPKEAIVGVLDYKLPYLFPCGMKPKSFLEECINTFTDRLSEGYNLAQVYQYMRDKYLPEYPPLFIPEDNAT